MTCWMYEIWDLVWEIASSASASAQKSNALQVLMQIFLLLFNRAPNFFQKCIFPKTFSNNTFLYTASSVR